MKPSNYPETIYKYRTWTNSHHKKILTENQLYLATPKDFNDPLDCRIGNNYGLLDTDEKIEEYAEIVTERHKVAVMKMGLDPQSEKQRIIRELQTDMKSVQKGDDEHIFTMQDKHFGVLSLSERFDSILMWSHYADFHKGFFVGFNEEKMRQSNLFGKGGPITYDTEFPKIDPRNNRGMDKSFVQTHTKAEDWAYEKEYRLTKLFFPNEPEQNARIVTFPAELISEVILGLKMPEEHKKEIIEIAKQKKIPIFEIEQIQAQFKLVKKPVANTRL
jgi:hypothetical protein